MDVAEPGTRKRPPVSKPSSELEAAGSRYSWHPWRRASRILHPGLIRQGERIWKTGWVGNLAGSWRERVFLYRGGAIQARWDWVDNQGNRGSPWNTRGRGEKSANLLLGETQVGNDQCIDLHSIGSWAVRNGKGRDDLRIGRAVRLWNRFLVNILRGYFLQDLRRVNGWRFCNGCTWKEISSMVSLTAGFVMSKGEVPALSEEVTVCPTGKV